jgi:hypothetical protein
MKIRVRVIGGIFALALFALGALLVSRFFDTIPSCVLLRETQGSPDGSLIAERFDDACDVGESAYLSVRRSGDAPRRWHNVFLYPSGDTDSVLFKWLNNTQLLVAVPERDYLGSWPVNYAAKGKPEEINDVKISYGFYPKDPDAPRDPKTHEIVRKVANFSFEQVRSEDRLGGIHTISCDLNMIANDDDNFYRLHVELRAFKQTFENARNVSGGSIQIFANKSNATSTLNATSVSFDDWIYASNTEVVGRNFQPVVDRNAAEFLWIFNSEISENQINKSINNIKRGLLDIKVGDWLTNSEIIYSVAAPSNVVAVYNFEKCNVENGIFDKAR